MRDLNELNIFAAIADEMSFTRAADALGVSKAAASKAIARMEARLGARLFERSTRRLRLTEAGEIYLGYSRRALEEANDGEAAVTKLNEKPRGTLRVIMPVTLAQASVAPNLARFLRRYPELRVEIRLGGGQIDPVAQTRRRRFSDGKANRRFPSHSEAVARISNGHLCDSRLFEGCSSASVAARLAPALLPDAHGDARGRKLESAER